MRACFERVVWPEWPLDLLRNGGLVCNWRWISTRSWRSLGQEPSERFVKFEGSVITRSAALIPTWDPFILFQILVWKELNYGSMNEQEKQQLVAEVNILRELRNPFIVRYYDRIVDKRTTRSLSASEFSSSPFPGRLYIVMEHCAGGDLGKVIRKCKRDR